MAWGAVEGGGSDLTRLCGSSDERWRPFLVPYYATGVNDYVTGDRHGLSTELRLSRFPGGILSSNESGIYGSNGWPTRQEQMVERVVLQRVTTLHDCRHALGGERLIASLS